MQGKQSALLAQHDEDGAQQPGAHIEWTSTGLRAHDNLLPIGNQITSNAVDAQKVLRCSREAVGIQLDGAWQMIRDLAQSDRDRMRSGPLVLCEGNSGSTISEKNVIPPRRYTPAAFIIHHPQKESATSIAS